MKTNPTRLLLAAAALACASSTVLLNSGCIVLAAGAGAGTVAYVRGDLETTLNASIEKCVKASVRGLEDLKFVKVSEKSDALSGEVIARTADDKRIQVMLKKEASGVTKLAIRVSAFGDSRIQQAVLEKIKENL